MPLVFKAPIEFFHSDLYPDRCLLTGRADNLRHYDVQLPYLNGGVPAIVLPLRPVTADPPCLPPPADYTTNSANIGDSDDTDRDMPLAPRHPPLPLQEIPWYRRLLGVAVWTLLAAWLGALFGEQQGAAWGAGGMLTWILLYNLLIRNWHRRRIDATAQHFPIALAVPNSAERRVALFLTLALILVNLLYYAALAAIALPRQYLPFSMPVELVFWCAWIVFMIINGWRNRRFTVLRLYPKQKELEIRMPDVRKPLYDDLCTQFMRWKQRENFETAIRYDIDSEVDDFPEVDSGSWDQGDRRS